MPLRLTRLQISDVIVAQFGAPTQQFLRYFNKALEKIEDAVNGLADAIVTIQAAQAAAAAAQSDADAANTALANGAILVEDEGGAGVETHTVNFVGAGVSAAVAGGVATVTVPGGSGALTLIESYTADGTTGTKAFTSIPNTYGDLEIRISGRTSDASNQLVNVTVNALGVSGYDIQRQYATGTTNTADNFLAQASWAGLMRLPGTGATAGFVAGGEIILHRYANTTFHKLMIFRTRHINSTTTGSGYIMHGSGVARTTSAISTVTLTLDAGNFVTGSVIALYGRS